MYNGMYGDDRGGASEESSLFFIHACRIVCVDEELAGIDSVVKGRQ